MKAKFTSGFALAAAFASAVQAHMELSYPAPYRSKYNPNANSNTIDYSMTSPLSGSAQYPCKGYQTDFGTDAGKSVATWAAGATHNFTVAGSAVHGGGSCQTALSYDKGATFQVMTSFEGSCPLSDGESFSFTVPSDATAGDAIFAWTWFNKVGNREIYMNCATVTIGGSSSKRAVGGGAVKRGVAFSARPDLLQANLGNGCTTVEGKEVVYPNPGPDVVDKQTGDNSGSLTGSCASGSSSSGSSSSGGSSAAVSSATSSTVASPAAAESSATSTTEAAATSATAPAGGVFATVSLDSTTSSSVASATSVTSTTAVLSAPSATATAAPFGNSTDTSGTTGACTSGQFYCHGTTFQQCDNGAWDVVQAVAPGTKCTPGIGSTIDVTAA